MNEIILEGFALTRAVFLNGDAIDLSEVEKHSNISSDGFNWGYVGAGPKYLAFGVLLKAKGVEVASEHYEEFSKAVIGIIPNSSFRVKIYLDDFLNASKHEGKRLHAFYFMDFAIYDHGMQEYQNFESKYLDFPNNGFKQAIFEPNTIEYHYLKKMSRTRRERFQRHLFHLTNRKEDKKDVFMEVEYDNKMNMFLVTGGMGSESFRGHKISEYEYR